MVDVVRRILVVDDDTQVRQILRKRLENVRGVGSVNLVGALKRQINVYLKPDALQALGLRAEQVSEAVRL